MSAFNGYRAVVETRRRELPSRFGFATFLAVGAWILVGPVEAGVWLSVFFTTQLVDASIGHRSLKSSGRGWERLYWSAMLVSAVTFSSLGALTWFGGGATGQIFAMLMLAGALLNTTVVARRAPSETPPVWFTHAGFLVGLPLIGGALSPERDLLSMAFVSCGGGLFIAHLLLALRRLTEEQDERRRAIDKMAEALERTERSQQRLKLAVEIADLHVWECDYLRQTVETDGAADTFFDYEVDAATLLRDTNSTIDPRDRAHLAAEWKAAVEEDRPFRPEYRVYRRDGKEVWATCTVKLVRDEQGRPIRMIGAMQNITDRKAAERELLRAKEEAEAANHAKSTFLATMSHEIRTPLNGVIGMAQAMEADSLSPLQRDRLSVVRQSGESLLAVLNDVLDLSKIEAGKLELEIGDFDLSKLMMGAHAAFTAVAERKGLDFNLRVAAEARGRYRTDSTRLRQIVYNLISNALKFTDAGEVALVVARAPEGLVIEVSDTGCGISNEALERLFNKFEQADASTTRRYGGTGLGLAICRDLATLLGGAITAASREDVGAVFTLRLPLQRMGDEEPDAGTVAAPEPPLAPVVETKFRVLAAEDNSVNQLVLKTLLHQFGVEPVIVANGAEALAAWRADNWDLILMDVQMPVLDGPSATRAIRAEEARTGRPPTRIVALTANAMSYQVESYLAAGMDGFVAKPIDARRLYEALADLAVA